MVAVATVVLISTRWCAANSMHYVAFPPRKDSRQLENRIGIELFTTRRKDEIGTFSISAAQISTEICSPEMCYTSTPNCAIKLVGPPGFSLTRTMPRRQCQRFERWGPLGERFETSAPCHKQLAEMGLQMRVSTFSQMGQAPTTRENRGNSTVGRSLARMLQAPKIRVERLYHSPARHKGPLHRET